MITVQQHSRYVALKIKEIGFEPDEDQVQAQTIRLVNCFFWLNDPALKQRGHLFYGRD